MEAFLINVRLHQESALSSFLFMIVTDELTKGVQDEVPWCVYLVMNYDIVLVDEIKDGVNNRLQK